MYDRTKKNFINATVSLITQLVLLVVGFIARKYFIDYLGAEVLGLNTTATSILNALNLLEAGVWSAIAVTMYKPIFEKDTQAIRELVAYQAWLYKIIGFLVIAFSAIVICFFPQIFSKSNLPAWYPYTTFLVLLYSFLLRFFVNFKRLVVYADQKDYKILLVLRITSIFKLSLQAWCVYKTQNGYVWWLIIEFVSATVSTIITNAVVYKNYPFLKEKVEKPAELRHKYPDVLDRMKLVSVHNIGQFALLQLSPILIYAFTSLSSVAMYGNYTLITVNLSTIISSLEAGTGSGIGNMVAEGDKKLILKVYKEYFTAKSFIIGFCAICIWLFMEPFITFWLGSEYILARTTLLLIIASFAILEMEKVNDSFLTAYALFKDIWVPFVNIAVSVGAGILLGRIWGLDGVLLGSLLPVIPIYLFWKPFYLFRSGFQLSYFSYLKIAAKPLIIFGAMAFAAIKFAAVLPIDPIQSVSSFILYVLIVAFATFAVYFALMFFLDSGFKNFLQRFILACGRCPDTA